MSMRSSSGCFTVKSAYLVAMSMGSREETGNLSNDAGMSYFWHSLWHLNLPRRDTEGWDGDDYWNDQGLFIAALSSLENLGLR